MYQQIAANKRKTWLLVAIFSLVVLVVGWAVDYVYNTGLGAVGLASLVAIVMSMGGYYGGDKVALATAGAKEIVKADNPYVYRIVENLCIAAGLPMPKVHLIVDPSINAFATGRDPEHASIAITTGAVEQLANEELEGVVAHELSHIKNYDIRLMTIVIVLVGFISIIGDMFWHIRPRGRSSDDNKAGGLLMIIGIILIIFSPLIAKLIQLAVSRKREYLADASAALLTRFPDGLANALDKIKNQNQPLAKKSAATAHLYISDPFSKKSFNHLFATHPPIDERIKILRGLTAPNS